VATPHFLGQGIQYNHWFELPVSVVLDSKMAAVLKKLHVTSNLRQTGMQFQWLTQQFQG